MKNMKKAVFLLFGLLLSFGQIVSAQVDEEKPIKVETVLLNVPLIVSDKNGRSIGGLKKEDFTVVKGGETQVIEYFLDTDVPMNVAVLIDTSGSAAPVLGDIGDAARAFLSQLRPEDKGMVVTADYEIKVLQTLTSDQKKLKQGVDGIFVADLPGSRMNDAIYQVLTKDFAGVKGRKAIIVLTDGYIGGKIPYADVLNELKESDTLIYPIFYQIKRLFPREVKTVSYTELIKVYPVSLLNTLAAMTGGRIYAAEGSDFRTAFQNIAEDLKKQYVLGFYPTDPSNRSANNLKITVERNDVVVRTKRSIKLSPPEPDPKAKKSRKKK